MDQRVYIRLLLWRRQGGGGMMCSDDCVQEANWRGFVSDRVQGAAQTLDRIALYKG